MRVEAIIPKNPIFNVPLFRQLNSAGVRATAQQAKSDFESTTRGWKHSVEFFIHEDADSVTVGTDSALYAGINDGVAPYTIRAKRNWMVFPSGYRAKTSPGVLGSGGGGGFGKIIRARQVKHHVTARHFDKAVLARTERPFINRMIDAIVKANK